MATQAALGISLFIVAERRFVGWIQTLPPETYSGGAIIVSAFHSWRVQILGVLATLIPLAFYRRLRWEMFDSHVSMRRLVVALCLAIAWWLSLCDFNYYFGQAHLFDRILVVATALLVAYHPGALGVFLVQAFAMAHQFDYPLVSSWTDLWLLLEILLLVYAFILLRIPFARLRFEAILVASLCLLGSFYLRACAEITFTICTG